MKLSEFHNQTKNESAAESMGEEDIMSKYNELKDLSSDQLYQMLLNEVVTQKKNGTFNYDQIMQSMDVMRPMMQSETYENMKRILDSLR